jgi:hypothetical protein
MQKLNLNAVYSVKPDFQMANTKPTDIYYGKGTFPRAIADLSDEDVAFFENLQNLSPEASLTVSFISFARKMMANSYGIDVPQYLEGLYILNLKMLLELRDRSEHDRIVSAKLRELEEISAQIRKINDFNAICALISVNRDADIQRVLLEQYHKIVNTIVVNPRDPRIGTYEIDISMMTDLRKLIFYKRVRDFRNQNTDAVEFVINDLCARLENSVKGREFHELLFSITG